MVETQLPDPPVTHYVPLLLNAKPKGNIRGGRPDGIDLGGPPRYLGCEYQRTGDVLEKRTFEVVKACFEDDNTCLSAPPYEKPVQRPSVDQELARCENLCNSGDQSCLVYPEVAAQVGAEMFKFYVDLSKQQVPFATDMSSLFSALGAPTATSCGSRLLQVDVANDAAAFGPQCRFPIATPAGTPVDRQSLVVDVPTLITGGFTRRGAGAAATAKIQFSDTSTIKIERTLPGQAAPLTDPIVAAYFSSRRLLVAGRKDFCAVLPYKGG